MERFTDRTAYTQCCNAKAKAHGQRTVQELFTISSDMWCDNCKREILPHEYTQLTWIPEYIEIAKGIYRKNPEHKN